MSNFKNYLKGLFWEYKKPTTLFGVDNAKTIKGEKLGYKTFILYGTPADINSMGKNLCAKATEGCKKACLVTSGRGGFQENVILGRLNKTEFFLRDREAFMQMMVKEIKRAVKNKKENIAIRLNGTTDIPYEHIKVDGYNNIFEMFPDVQFYDYTAIYKRLGNVPSNLHLTFSRKETEDNHIEALMALKRGFNVSVVFDGKPKMWEGYEVIDGDEHDLTFLHKKNCVVGLKAKGKARKDTTGFVVRTEIAQMQAEIKKANRRQYIKDNRLYA